MDRPAHTFVLPVPPSGMVAPYTMAKVPRPAIGTTHLMPVANAIQALRGDFPIHISSTKEYNSCLRSDFGQQRERPVADVRQWLSDLGLERYAQLFAENEIDLAALRHITDQDLKELGVPMGPRKVIAAAIPDLPEAVAAHQAPRPTAPHDPERRQVTVLFCDLVELNRAERKARSRGPSRRHPAVSARGDGHRREPWRIRRQLHR